MYMRVCQSNKYVYKNESVCVTSYALVMGITLPGVPQERVAHCNGVNSQVTHEVLLSKLLPLGNTQIHKDVEAVAVCHQDMSERLKATRTVTSELISQTAQFRSDTKQLEMKSKVRMSGVTEAAWSVIIHAAPHVQGLCGQKEIKMMLE